MRLFFGIDLPQELKNEYVEAYHSFKKNYNYVKWVDPGLLHVTLMFIGEVAEERVGSITSLVDLKTIGLKPFKIECNNLGFLPSNRNPRVIYLKIVEGNANCSILYEYLCNIFPEYRESPGKSFTPHITIGRIRDRAGNNKITAEKAVNGSFNVKNIVLFNSVLSSSGSKYFKLKEFEI